MSGVSVYLCSPTHFHGVYKDKWLQQWLQSAVFWTWYGVVQILFGWSYQEEDGQSMWHVWRHERCIWGFGGETWCKETTKKTWIQMRGWYYKTGDVSITSHWGELVQLLLQWKINKNYIFWVCVCNIRYPACNAHASYCHPWPAPLCNILPTLSHQWYDFRK